MKPHMKPKRKESSKKKMRSYRDRKRCRFKKEDHIDYKDLELLSKFCSAQGKLFSRKRSGNCAQCQRRVARAIKYARYLALMPYVG
ncbi:MAG: 30S ribosomal protein S18 [Planctomycetota bacterium]|jgi:small subunit ribosomal protein S18|nr:30S ribosomal protein S18 [Planctomycetota bacterium]